MHIVLLLSLMLLISAVHLSSDAQLCILLLLGLMLISVIHLFM